MTELIVEPEQPVTRAWALRFNVAWVGVTAGLFGPIQVLLPNQAEALSPDHKQYVLGLVTSLGAACSLVANPLWGALSDRTVSRFGRRLPWIVAGTIGGVLGLVVLASARNVATMTLGWCLVQTALNAPWAALTATVPDQVPVRQRGRVAGWLGFAQILGALIAVGLATVFPGPVGYLACAGVLVVTTVPFLLQRRNRDVDGGNREPLSWHNFLGGFWISPRRHPDFAWAWFTRFLINLGNAFVLVYLLYYLRDELGSDHAEADLLILSAVNCLGVAAAVVVSGIYSDRLGRRKPFVAASGLVMAAAAIVAMAPSWPALLVTAGLLGIGFGVYTAVDLALITQVLPAAGEQGKDMGVLNIAGTLPQVLAPAVAAPVVVLVGYPLLFAIAGVAAAAGGVLVHRIRSVA